MSFFHIQRGPYIPGGHPHPAGALAVDPGEEEGNVYAGRRGELQLLPREADKEGPRGQRRRVRRRVFQHVDSPRRDPVQVHSPGLEQQQLNRTLGGDPMRRSLRPHPRGVAGDANF